MCRTRRRRWARTSTPPGVLPGRSTTATGRLFCVSDVDRQEAAFVIMSVEQRELLMAVDDIAGIIDVERDGCRLARVATPQSGHCSMQSALRICANIGNDRMTT